MVEFQTQPIKLIFDIQLDFHSLIYFLKFNFFVTASQLLAADKLSAQGTILYLIIKTDCGIQLDLQPLIKCLK